MIQAISSLRFEAIERPPGQMVAPLASFVEFFEDAEEAAMQKADTPAAPATSAADTPASTASNAGIQKADTPAAPAASAADTPASTASNAGIQKADTPAAPASSAVDAPASTASNADTSLGDPDVQGWLNSYWAEAGNASDANISYQPASGAPNNYQAGSVYGPDTIYTQALDNQISTSFAALTGGNPAEYQSQLPGTPSQQVQQQFDQNLAMENAQRLSLGEAIDTSAYWSDPGPINYEGTTYTSQELGYAGPEQSSGPQPIYISGANQIGTTGTYGVPGYSGTVSGIQPGRYYTLQQLEQAGLQTGQPDTQDHPGSWTTTQSA